MFGQTQGLYQTPTTATGTSIVARKNLSALQASSIVPAHKPPVSVMEMVVKLVPTTLDAYHKIPD